MNNYLHYWIVAVFFLTVLIFSVLINGLFLRFSKSLGIRNEKDMIIRWGPQSKPAFGGISFYIGFLISALASGFLFSNLEFLRSLQFLTILFVCTIAFLLGLFDDAYNTRPRIKFLTQLACAVLLIFSGIYIQIFESLWVNYALTIFWVVGLMNSLNMLDNMDGITTSVTAVILITVVVLMQSENNLYSPLTFIVIGVIASLLGFLRYNWNPSKMYMGDTGSQFVGVFVAIAGIMFLWNNKDLLGEANAPKQLFTTVLVFILPITDTATVVIKRMGKGNSPFIGGKDHTTHHLSYLIKSDKAVALIFILVGAVSSWIAVAIFNTAGPLSPLCMTGIISYILLVSGTLFTIALTSKPKD